MKTLLISFIILVSLISASAQQQEKTIYTTEYNLLMDHYFVVKLKESYLSKNNEEYEKYVYMQATHDHFKQTGVEGEYVHISNELYQSLLKTDKKYKYGKY